MNPSKRTLLAVVVGFVVLGWALRLYRINVVALRGDEVFTVGYWMRDPLSTTIDRLATTDPHPPLAYALFRGWDLAVGPDERTARLLPALLSLLGIPAIYAVGRRLGSPRVGLLAALLWAIHPYIIWHAQDARNYAIWSALSLVAVWLATRALSRDRRLDWILYVVAAGLAAYVYYLELFVVLVLNVYAVAMYWRQWKRLGHWFAAQVAIGLLLAPWFIQSRLLTGSGYGGTSSGFDVRRLWVEFVPTLAFGAKTLPESLTNWLWLPLMVVFSAASLALWRRRRRLVTLAVPLAILPLSLLALVSLKLSVFEPRYVLATAPAYILLLSAFVVWLWHQSPRSILYRGSSVLLLGLWVGLGAISLSNYYWIHDYAKAPDWQNVVAYLKQYSNDGDLIVQASADEALNFYYGEYGYKVDRKQLPANPQQSIDEIDSLLAKDEPTHTSIWRVGQSFPDWPNVGVVEHWLSDHMQLVRDTTVSRVHIQQYMPWTPRPFELAPAPLATFGDAAQLVGARVHDPLETPDALTVWLYWKPLATTVTPLKVFVQVLGTTNPSTGTPLWTQDDQLPQDGRIDTTRWQAGDVFRDVYELPLSTLPAGDYTLVVGLYDPSTGARLTVDGQDHYVIQGLTVGS